MKAAIVGAGLTGLTIAYELTKAGWSVAVLERASQPGGLLATIALGRGRIEKFYHHFFAQDQETVQFLRELEIAGSLYWRAPKMGIFCRGQFHSFTTPLDLLRFSPLSWGERIKLGLFTLQAAHSAPLVKLDHQTAEEWLRQQVGPQITDLVWRPLLQSKFGRHYQAVPAAWLWSRLAARAKSRGFLSFREKLGYLQGSYQVLLDALLHNLGGRVRCQTDVRQVPVPGFDVTIVTTPEVYCPPQMSYLGNICVLLKMRRPFCAYYWTNIADPGLPFCALVEHTNAFTAPDYQGEKILYLPSYLDQQDVRWQRSDQQIIDNYLSGLHKLKPDFQPEQIIAALVFRARYAQPLPTRQYAALLPPFKVNEQLYFVSNMQIYPADRGVDQSIRLAKRFCRELVQ